MDYAFLISAVLMFGVQFMLSDKYEKREGNGASSVFIMSLLSALTGAFCLFIINGVQNGFGLEFTPFTFFVAFAAAINMVLYMLCSLKSLSKINLSLYSLFAMLGGMMLPFLVGIIFYDEPITVGKGICVALVILSLALTVERGEKKRGGAVYYVGVFLLNGMAGVISKIYESADVSKATVASYSLWIAIITAVISLVALLIIRRKVKRPSVGSACIAIGSGALNQVANFLLLMALLTLPASVQYPFVTGGVMIVSTVISAIVGQKPKPKEIISVCLAFVGVFVLVLV